MGEYKKWVVSHERFNGRVSVDIGEETSVIDVWHYSSMTNRAQAKERAKLISAAPMLLDALQALVIDLKTKGISIELAFAEKAIKEATK